MGEVNSSLEVLGDPLQHSVIIPECACLKNSIAFFGREQMSGKDLTSFISLNGQRRVKIVQK